MAKTSPKPTVLSDADLAVVLAREGDPSGLVAVLKNAQAFIQAGEPIRGASAALLEEALGSVVAQIEQMADEHPESSTEAPLGRTILWHDAASRTKALKRLGSVFVKAFKLQGGSHGRPYKEKFEQLPVVLAVYKLYCAGASMNDAYRRVAEARKLSTKTLEKDVRDLGLRRPARKKREQRQQEMGFAIQILLAKGQTAEEAIQAVAAQFELPVDLVAKAHKKLEGMNPA